MYCVYCSRLDLALCMLLTFACFHVEIGQIKASDKDIELAWERIETFLWNHVGPASVAHSTDQQNQNQVQRIVLQPNVKAEDSNGTTHVSSTGGA